MFSKTSTNSSTRGFILVLYQLDHTKSSISVHSVLFCSYLHSTVLSHYGRTYSLLRLSRPTDCQGSAGPSQAGTHGTGRGRYRTSLWTVQTPDLGQAGHTDHFSSCHHTLAVCPSHQQSAPVLEDWSLLTPDTCSAVTPSETLNQILFYGFC